MGAGPVVLARGPPGPVRRADDVERGATGVGAAGTGIARRLLVRSLGHLLAPIGTALLLLGLVGTVAREAHRIARAAGSSPSLHELGVAPATGEPVLVLVADSGCSACRAALAERRRLRAASLGVDAVPVPPPAGTDLLLPSWLLFDGDGAPLGVLRGYHPPETVREWIVDRLGRPR